MAKQENSTVDASLTITHRGLLYRFYTGYEHARYRATPRTSGLSGHRSPSTYSLPAQLAAADYVVLRYV